MVVDIERVMDMVVLQLMLCVMDIVVDMIMIMIMDIDMGYELWQLIVLWAMVIDMSYGS